MMEQPLIFGFKQAVTRHEHATRQHLIQDMREKLIYKLAQSIAANIPLTETPTETGIEYEMDLIILTKEQYRFLQIAAYNCQKGELP